MSRQVLIALTILGLACQSQEDRTSKTSASAPQAPKAAAPAQAAASQEAPQAVAQKTSPTAAKPPAVASNAPLNPVRKRNRFAVKKDRPALPPAPTANRPKRFSPGSHAKFNELKDAASDGQSGEDKGAPRIERLDEDRVKVGQIIANRKTREVIVPGHVNMTTGILEYYAVAPQGKTHESVITYDGFASHVHLALLLIGMEPKPQQADLLDLTLSWVDPYTKKRMTTASGQWMVDRKNKSTPKRLPWGFTGSSFWNGRYAGDSSHCLVSLIQDANCTIVLQDQVENPYQGDNMGYEVNTKLIPPRRTPVSLIITPKRSPETP